METGRRGYGFISIHAPREGGDDKHRAETEAAHYFNPRPPRGGRLADITMGIAPQEISIHAPREGGDFSRSVQLQLPHGISIHAPREGGDYTSMALLKE